MALPKYRDEVVVRLSSVSVSSVFTLPDRSIFLTKTTPIAKLGRTSKRNASFEAAKDNGWIDSAVMSRDHAELRLDSEQQAVYLKDIGSLHGTFQNEQRIPKNQSRRLKNGDIVKFGASIERGLEKFPPCIMKVMVEFGSEKSEQRPVVFRVPDDSDIEDISSDDDADIRNSSEVLRSHNIRPANAIEVIEIDLTSNEPAPTYSIGNGGKHAAEIPSPVSDRRLHSTEFDDFSEEDSEDDAATEKHFESFSNVIGSNVEYGFDTSELEVANSSDLEGDGSIHASSFVVSDNNASPDSQSSFPDFSVASEIAHDEDSAFMGDDDFIGEEEFGSPPVSPGDPTATVHDTEQPTASGSADTDAKTTPLSSDFQGSNTSNIKAPSPFATTDTPLPSVALVFEKLSSLASGPYVDPFTMTLPAILEPSSTTRQQQPKSVAELMGAKTGKFEYFAAREQNKANAQLVVDDSIAPAEDLVEESQGDEQDSNHLSPLLSSGAQFLASPPEEKDEPYDTAPTALDETSAFAYEKSKRTHMDIRDIIDDTCAQQSDCSVRSGKRKAVAISDISSEERQNAMLAGIGSGSVPEDNTKVQLETALVSPPVISSQIDVNRPAKRLRRVAEVFGYAALGGVAVVSALIATAPAL